jgi:hypothetical protein
MYKSGVLNKFPIKTAGNTGFTNEKVESSDSEILVKKKEYKKLLEQVKIKP